jgi:predicted transposase YbfD/YdcC
MEVNQEGNILTIFEQLVDPRMDRTKLHLLEDIVMLTMMAVICGADSYTEIYEFGIAKQAWLKTFLKLANGIPSHDTIGRVMSSIYPEEFEHCFIQWVLKSVNLTEGELVSIDGKTLRKSYNKRDDKAAIHMVSAWANKNRMVLGQIKTDEKSNEITAIPELLRKLVIKGCIVTIDAMGCQKEIAKEIVAGEADYILAIKGNQGGFFENVKHQFNLVTPHDTNEQTDAGHGRIEIRKCSVINDLKFVDEAEDWEKLTSLIKIDASRIIGDTRQEETRYYISSLNATAEKCNELVRGHWAIENELHWTLDIAFREDECRIRTGYGAENFSTVRRIALNLLKRNTTIKRGIKTKRMKAGWDNDYLAEILKI